MKNGQTSMDFVMSYGWAIMAVLIIVAALSYFVFFKKENTITQKCQIEPPLLCKDFSIDATTGRANIGLMNANDVRVDITSVTITHDRGIFSCDYNPPAPVSLAVEQQKVVTTNICKNEDGTLLDDTKKLKDIQKYKVEVKYKEAKSTFDHTIKGNIVASGVGDTIKITDDSTPPTTSYNFNENKINLNCNDDNIGCSDTYYCITTTDCEPNTKYTEPIGVSKTGKINFYSEDNAGNKETKKTETYIVVGSGMTTELLGNIANPLYADTARNVIAPNGDYLYVLGHRLNSANSYEAYVKKIRKSDGTEVKEAVFGQTAIFQTMWGITYAESGGSGRIIAVGHKDAGGLMQIFDTDLNTLATITKPTTGIFEIWYNVAVYNNEIYTTGSIYKSPDSYAGLPVDGVAYKFAMDGSTLAGPTLIWESPGYRCSDEIEANSMAVDSEGVFVLADVDKQCKDTTIKEAGGIVRLSLDLSTKKYFKFVQGRTADSIAKIGTKIFISGMDSTSGKQKILLAQTSWTGTDYSTFKYNNWDYPSGIRGGLAYGGTIAKQTPTGYTILQNGFADDTTSNCIGVSTPTGPCRRWLLNYIKIDASSNPTLIQTNTWQYSTNTADFAWGINWDEDNKDFAYQVGCTKGTVAGYGNSGTECFNMLKTTTGWDSAIYKVTLT